MKFIFSLMGFFSVFVCAAQKTEKYYDYKWKPSDASTARYYSVVEKKDSVWHRQDFYIREKKLQMEGYFIDSNCRLKTGDFKYYYSNGNLKSSYRYIDNVKEGYSINYFDNGQLRDSILFIKGKMSGEYHSFYKDGKPFENMVPGNNETISWLSIYENGFTSSKGNYTPDRKKDGTWQFFHGNGKPSSVEEYDKGKLLTRQYFDERGNMEIDTANTDRMPLFKGGNKGWKKFLENHLEFPDGYHFKNGDVAVVVVEAIVDEEGNLGEISVAVPFTPTFDKLAVEIMKKSPKWLPAIDHHRRVGKEIRQEISFIDNGY